MVTAYYVNRADQFHVNFRLYHQFPRREEQAALKEAFKALAAQPDLMGYRQLLVHLLKMEVRRRLYRPKTQLGAQLVREAVRYGLP